MRVEVVRDIQTFRLQIDIVPGNVSTLTAGNIMRGDFGVPLEMTARRYATVCFHFSLNSIRFNL